MILGGNNHLATLVEREAIAATFQLTVARVVHVVDGEHMIHLALATVAGSDANDGGLVNVVAFGATRGTNACSMWIHDCQLEVSVAQASPAPVDVVVVAHLIAVAHERVSAATTCTAVVNHGTASNELLINHVFPRLLVVVAAIN